MMENDYDKRIKMTMSAVFNVPIELIGDDSSLHTVKGWDSLNHMKMIVALEEEFSIQFDYAETEAMINMNIIKSTIYSYIM